MNLNIGSVFNDFLGIPITVKSRDDEIVNEVKRLGFLIDRGVDLELRVGDIMVFYIQMAVE